MYTDRPPNDFWSADFVVLMHSGLELFQRPYHYGLETPPYWYYFVPVKKPSGGGYMISYFFSLVGAHILKILILQMDTKRYSDCALSNHPLECWLCRIDTS